ncbi:hypothetical protein C4585_00970 [Candidatus Parcubacteria bacterium]|nr:MAG: hypothetical protein C4585_00970 [Candidatus Parcubacteria bacterium]
MNNIGKSNPSFAPEIMQPKRHFRFFPFSISARSQRLAAVIADWSILGLFTFLPFFFLPVSWVSIPQAKTILIAIVAVVATVSWVAHVLSEGTARLPRSLLLFAAALVPVAYFVSAFATGASWTSFVGGVQQDTVVAVLIGYALFISSAAVLSQSFRKLTSALRGFMLGGVLVLLIQIVKFIVPDLTFGEALVGQAASVIGSWHDLGIFVGLLFFFAVAFLSTPLAQGGWWKLLLRGIAVLSFFLLVIINFSDVWLALFILAFGYALALFYISRPSEETIRRAVDKRVFLWGAIALLIAGFYFGGTTVHNLLPSSLRVTQFEVRPSWQGTYSIGANSLTQPASIFFGSGPNTFPREWVMHKPSSVNATEFWNIDFYAGVGFIPTSFVTVGLLGVLAWGAVCLAVLYTIWVFLRARRNSVEGIFQMILGASAVYLTAFHILYVPGPTLSALLFLVFGAMVASGLLSQTIRPSNIGLSLDTWKDRVWVGALAVLSVVVFLGGVQSVRALTSDVFVNRAVAIFNETEDFSRATRQTEIALAILPQNDRAHRAAVELGILQFSKLAAESSVSEEARASLQNTLTATIQHGLEAVAIENSNYQNWLLLARLYGDLAGAGVEGAEEQARAAYAEAQKNNPTNPLPYLGVAQLDLLSGNDDSARENLNKAIELKSNLASARFLLSQLEARAGNLDAAFEQAAIVVQVVPNDALGWYNVGTILYAKEDYANAALAFERAVGIQNNYSNALYLLSASYTALERSQDALTAMRAVESLNPDNQDIKKVREQLEAGQNPFSTE